MAYRPQVVSAQIVSKNQSNDLFQVVAQLEDRLECRLTFSGDASTGDAKATHISRLLKEPCPICRKDYLCNCMTRYMEPISVQVLEKLK
ncbi:hypothetical protein SY83_17470 [Paenibacillus swuensis]|uniref:Uncharacterized protein n=1 Tax=Paenibacillus swuensis TaxID=1178515 RepID=A0A172TL41_9BACL|nr:hypothetical protein [Paenibacillus swuensis]ANE47775.1 hypothetical protein SY83_17470 [Paenibacillus swuensis]